MYKRSRVIPTLLLNDEYFVKTIRFSHPNYIGDPINTVRIFNDLEVDELCILDISATLNKKEPNYDLLTRISSEAFMPLSYGGGISRLEQIKKIFSIGFEKVIINSAFFYNQNIVIEAAKFAGSQSIVVSIDAKKDMWGYYNCYSHSGKARHKVSPAKLAKRAEECGAGEILLNSIDRDGKMRGYDLKLIQNVSKELRIPLIACGGAGKIDDFQKAFFAGADAVAAGSFFVYYGKLHAVLINAPSEAEYVENGIFTRIL